MTTIWVDGIIGHDANSGATRTEAKQTITAAVTAISSSGTIKIVQGTYAESVPAGLVTYKNIIIEGLGFVKIAPGSSTHFLHVEEIPFLTTTTVVVLRNIIVTDFRSVMTFQAVNNQDSTKIALQLFCENCTFYNTGPVSGDVVRLEGLNFFTLYVDLHMQNCTIENVRSIGYRVEDGNPDQHSRLVYERNNIYNVTSMVVQGALASAYTPIRLNPKYNALPLADITDPTEFDVAASPPSYVSTYPATIDLSIVRGSTPAYIGSGGSGPGDFGNDIGAAWWPTNYPESTALGYVRSEETTTTAFFPSNWATSNWKNDAYWFNESLQQPGTDAVAASELRTSPATFSVVNKKWIIDPGHGLGASAKVISPVLDFGAKIDFKSLTFWGEERPTLPSGQKEVLDADMTGTDRQMEFRFSNTPFLETDASPTWFTIRRFDAPVPGPTRYWQFKVTLRRDATS